MKVRDIVALVREYLDEVEAVNDIIELNGSYPVERRILTLLAECAVQYMSGEPMSDSVKATFVVNDSGVAEMEVPSDWGRLYELKLTCWKRSVYHTIEANSEQYRRQQNIVTRGGIARPVVAIVPHGEGRRLEMYSVPVWDSRAAIERAMYVPLPETLSMESELNVEASYKSELSYMVAIRVARSYGRATAVELLSASLQEEMLTKRVKI